MALEQGPVHERLFHTITGLTKAEKRALASTSCTEPESVTVDELQHANRAAKVSRVPGHGLTIVEYAAGKKEQKQNTTTTSTGYTRNSKGGFYSS